jgi:lysophospholipase L1-like esterase
MPQQDPTTRLGRFEQAVARYPGRPKLLCEGDSWFAFPYATRRNVIRHLYNMASERPLPILNIAGNGDEIRQMMSGAAKQRFQEYLKKYSFDAILFSGGGNDIVGPEIASLLVEKTDGMTWQDCIDQDRFKRRLQEIECAMMELIDLRDDHAPAAHIITHSYDYAIPQNTPVKFVICDIAGPWIYPSMIEKRIRNRTDQRAIVTWMIDQFAGLLGKVAANADKFQWVDTRGTVQANEWGDEIHPTNEGFRKVAAKFLPALNALYPNAFPANDSP